MFLCGYAQMSAGSFSCKPGAGTCGTGVAGDCEPCDVETELGFSVRAANTLLTIEPFFLAPHTPF